MFFMVILQFVMELLPQKIECNYMKYTIHGHTFKKYSYYYALRLTVESARTTFTHVSRKDFLNNEDFWRKVGQKEID